jgi:hypothetical protein
MKRKLSFETPDSMTPPPSPFYVEGLSPIANIPTPQSQPAPGIQNNLMLLGGHLTLTPINMLPALPPVGFQTPNHNDQALVGIAALGGHVLAGTPGAINGNNMLNVMNPHAGSPVPFPPLQFEQLVNNNGDSDEDTDSLFDLSSSDNESDTKAEYEYESEDEGIVFPDDETTDEYLLDIALVLSTATPVRTPIANQQTPVQQIPNTGGTMPLDGLSPFDNNLDITDLFNGGETSSESGSEELNLKLSGDLELPFSLDSLNEDA